MGNLLVVAVVMLAACQPMYGRPAQTMKDPRKIKAKGTDVVEQPKYDDNCVVDFSAPPTTKRQTARSKQLVVDADTTLDRTKSAPPQQRGALTLRSIEHYRAALLADPYSAEATLKLALAYDKVLRRGCAIAMLKRLAKLTENPKLQADPTVERVVQNEQWFELYRQDALRAIGR